MTGALIWGGAGEGVGSGIHSPLAIMFTVFSWGMLLVTATGTGCNPQNRSAVTEHDSTLLCL